MQVGGNGVVLAVYFGRYLYAFGIRDLGTGKHFLQFREVRIVEFVAL